MMSNDMTWKYTTGKVPISVNDLDRIMYEIAKEGCDTCPMVDHCIVLCDQAEYCWSTLESYFCYGYTDKKGAEHGGQYQAPKDSDND